jgi:hypothetical protein
MNDAFFKPSLNVGSFIGENSSVDTERFLLFMQAYYEWMQSTTLTLTGKTGTFQVGETVVGVSSGATAIIKEVKTDSIVVKLTTKTVFNYSEIVEGQTSSASATISITKDNVGRATGNVLNYKTLETSVDKYVDYLREELYPSIPASYYGDKRLVAQYFKDFYQSKSNEQSYRFLFKLLYNEDIEFYYPGTDVLRVSDGNFEKTQIIRTEAIATGINSLGNPFDRDIFLFLNKTIRGKSSGFLANVVDIKKFFIGSREVAEMTLKLVSGTFTAGEDIVDIDDDNLVTTIYGIISGVTIIDGGSGYEEGDAITITGDGSEAQAKVSSIKESPISALRVDSVGHGYQLNTAATIDNTGTGGSGLIIKVTELANTYTVTSGSNTYTVGEVSKVSIINRGEGYFKTPVITLQDTTIASLGLLSENLITISNAGANYGVGNTLVFTGGAGANAAGRIASVVESTTFDLLFEDGMKMKADGSYYDIIKNEDWAVLGPIKRIELTNFGTGYSSANLPSISISTTTGSSANLVATNVQGKSSTISVDTANNITGIGSIRDVEIINFGINYSTANADATAVGDGNANLVPVISGLGIRRGVWLDDDGKIDYKIIQDSYYYQDYSYVIKSGLTFQTYSDTLKGIIHPAGLTYFGEINILNDIDVAAELVHSENISRMLVQIFGYLTVGGEYEYSNITWTVKVEAPTVRLDTNLLDVQEYVIHLVPEGDEETGITDVAIAMNQGSAVHSFVIQTPFEIDVTSQSATLPATKFVVSKFDIVPGYGRNTYGDLQIVSTGGVYGDDFGSTPISVLQDVRFDDLYSENPAYQSILNLFIDNTIDVSTLSTTTRLKYETFAVSGTIPILQSIVTTESLTIKPEIPIVLQVNDVAVTSFTEMNRELPVLIAETSTLTASKEYKLTGHATRLRKYGSILLSDYESVLISAVANVAFDDFIQSASSLADMNVEADFIFSTVAPQKFASAQNLVYLYRIDLGDVAISEVSNETFTDLLPQSIYEGISTTYETSTFESIYTVQPKQYQEYIKVLPVTNTELNNLSVNREITVRQEGHGFKYVIYNDLLLSDYESAPISTLADFTFDANFGTTIDDVTIKATTSPYSGGQSARRNPTDIFRNETRVDIQSASDGYALPYGDLPISTLEALAISGTLYDRQLSVETFGTTYPSIYTASDYTTYVKIAGTVSSATQDYSLFTIDDYSEIPIEDVDEVVFSASAPVVVGTGTNFETDYDVYDVFVANNEYFTVEAIANTTHMVVDRQPMNQYSGVVAYKIPTPTYAFSSVPTSINEGANGTFNVTTTDVANGTALYWTINNVTTGSGDFV